MTNEFTWKVGGAQGEGIDSTGEILATVLTRMGYYIFAYRHFMSLVKGGHTNYKIRANNEEQVDYHGDTLDILIAFDQTTIDENEDELITDGVILHDAKFAGTSKRDSLKICSVPMSQMAKDLGNVIIKNMVAAGASSYVLGIDPNNFYEQIEAQFGKKGAELVELNKTAFNKGYDYVKENYADVQRPVPAATKPATPRLLMTGNESIGVGALMAGCRILAAYPITPATEIMYWLLGNMKDVGGKVLQAEDEIAACIMAIGANYSGVRAMTSTSGPGLSLMMEAIGMAGISETPLVIIDVQRGGPSTGLPTKTEQSDLNGALYGSHGEIPRVVLAPTSIEDCYYQTFHAFNLAERYQCVVIVLSDLLIGMNKMTLDTIDLNRYSIDRGEMVTQEQLDALEKGAFKRFALTESGISPRSIPGMKNGRFCALTNEHEETGLEIEDVPMRKAQMNKRFRKMETLAREVNEWGVDYQGAESPELLLIGYGSTKAQIAEAVKNLDGMVVGHLQLRAMMPFPSDAVKRRIDAAKRVIVLDNNFTGQLTGLIHREIGYHDKTETLTKYDGNPFTVGDILSFVKG
ncbi:2-oxoglutarate ferredoxin oxidoreductase subunit alpha [Tumebacillus algifaecis]|uniref:2-oxoglutarate ferredoxin oxidoreductase subunit alpha n=1 Tax=Tumebacillus algifaecis TaxID=1214604 RepID=A0A223D765_9BACL|nr:2-oxoacid:acceptor oxidoreductase subunit alpha [Tumebacillus algifaecis]ASS77246.1 2-oxoglutarate ferredoxin oxidoreductase subunit alpha [Tumebacillus algifaecis]